LGCLVEVKIIVDETGLDGSSGENLRCAIVTSRLLFGLMY
jgi:hypothetical protein